ncbi:MAG: hypothetical protein R2693_07235 [Nocardioidaceae bacterium]
MNTSNAPWCTAYTVDVVVVVRLVQTIVARKTNIGRDGEELSQDGQHLWGRRIRLLERAVWQG